MAIQEVIAKKKVGEEEKTGTVAFDFGNDLNDAVEKFGAEVVFSNYVQSAKIALQALIRARLDKGANVEELAEIWKPGVTLERSPVDVLAQAKAKFQKMSQEERLAYLEMLQASMG